MSAATDTVLGYLDAFGRAEPAAIASFVTDDFHNQHLSELGSGCVGRDAYLGRLPGFLSSFPGARYDVDDVVEQDDAVVVRYRFSGTFDGVDFEIPGVMWFLIRDGRIARRTDLWDSLSFLRQTGQADSADQTG